MGFQSPVNCGLIQRELRCLTDADFARCVPSRNYCAVLARRAGLPYLAVSPEMSVTPCSRDVICISNSVFLSGRSFTPLLSSINAEASVTRRKEPQRRLP
jgi:hypothetical protein